MFSIYYTRKLQIMQSHRDSNHKKDTYDNTTEAVNPQAVFFIQVQSNSIVRSDNFTVGDNLSSSTLMQWTGPMQKSVVVQ